MKIVLSGSFDDFGLRHARLLDAASRLGDDLHVLLWSDAAVAAISGADPKFSQDERLYLLQAMKYVQRTAVALTGDVDPETIPAIMTSEDTVWAVDAEDDTEAKREFCKENGMKYRVIGPDDLEDLPPRPEDVQSGSASTRDKKVIVTGCYDWFHSGHVRFFEEVSELGQLYVSVGSDDNIELLKGDGHPLFPAEQRRYMVGSVRFVKEALIGSGVGWLDAAPDILRIRPDIYAVNEDGDRPEKREFCDEHGIGYVVLRREPKEGLARRESTDLRGF